MKNPLISFVFLLIFQFSTAQNQNITGFFQENIEQQLQLETAFDKNLSIESIDENLKLLSSRPHHLSSPGSKANAEYILGLYKKWGWDAEIETFHVLFHTKKTRVLEMTSPT